MKQQNQAGGGGWGDSLSLEGPRIGESNDALGEGGVGKGQGVGGWDKGTTDRNQTNWELALRFCEMGLGGMCGLIASFQTPKKKGKKVGNPKGPFGVPERRRATKANSHSAAAPPPPPI